jgi:hypothetical protein
MKFLRHLLGITTLDGTEINPSGRNLEYRTQFWKSNNTNESSYNMYREWTETGYPNRH